MGHTSRRRKNRKVGETTPTMNQEIVEHVEDLRRSLRDYLNPSADVEGLQPPICRHEIKP